MSPRRSPTAQGPGGNRSGPARECRGATNASATAVTKGRSSGVPTVSRGGDQLKLGDIALRQHRQLPASQDDSGEDRSSFAGTSQTVAEQQDSTATHASTGEASQQDDPAAALSTQQQSGMAIASSRAVTRYVRVVRRKDISSTVRPELRQSKTRPTKGLETTLWLGSDRHYSRSDRRRLSSASMKPSRSPSSTDCGFPTSKFVR